MNYKEKAFIIYKDVMKWRDKLMRNPAKWLLNIGITANMLSVSRLIFVIPMFLMVGVSPIAVIIFLFINYYVLDAMDGVLARVSNTASLKGRALDVCIDNFYVIPLVLGFIYFNLVNPFWAAFYLVNLLIDYFVKFVTFGIKEGAYPFMYSKFVVYFATLIWSLGFGNYFDFVLLFFATFLFVTNMLSLVKLYYDK